MDRNDIDITMLLGSVAYGFSRESSYLMALWSLKGNGIWHLLKTRFGTIWEFLVFSLVCRPVVLGEYAAFIWARLFKTNDVVS